MIRWLWFALVLDLFFGAFPAYAIEPGQVFLVANKNVPESMQVAQHYCQKRGVPRANIIILDLPTGDDISRADYGQRIVSPLRAALKNQREQALVVVTVYGVPLREWPTRVHPC
jgi:uncharacterized protein (TIGR03790 family)